MKGPTPRRLHQCACRVGLGDYLRAPGDGRSLPRIPAASLVWSLLLCKMLRVVSFYGTEMLARHAPGALGLERPFGDDALAYFTERLDPERTRQALTALLKRGYGHKLVAISVVGAGLDLPFDVEFYASGENEITVAKRLLERASAHLGRRFADYLVVDGLYPGAPFLHLADRLGLPVVAALKDNLPELSQAARRRFEGTKPHGRFEYQGGHVEIWDGIFSAWDGLDWPWVRVLRYRQLRRDGRVFEAYWLTHLPCRRVGPRALFRMAKSRWSIENQGSDDAKNRYGLEHIAHHQPTSILVDALVTFLAMCLERLYRLRYLRRGTHPPYSAIEFFRLLWLNLAPVTPGLQPPRRRSPDSFYHTLISTRPP